MEHDQRVEAPIQEIVTIDLDGQRVALSVASVGAGVDPSEETEIAAVLPTLETALRGASMFARRVVEEFQQTGASRVSVQFGCEIAVEAGALLAVISGKASGRSTFTVGLEWDKTAE